MIDSWLAQHLVCPRDHAELNRHRDQLVCDQGHGYPVIDDIPIMLVDEAHTINEAWLDYEQEHLAHNGFVPTSDELVDPYVQRMAIATCGHLYAPLVGRLRRYPIPELRLPYGRGQALLDVGCNWGRWSIAAARKGYRPIGIDPSLPAIHAARRVAAQLRLTIPYVVGDARYLPFATRSFDAVFSYSVLQHFDRDDALSAIREIGRVSKPGATTLVQMANCYALLNIYRQVRRGFRNPDSFLAARYWSPRALKRAFASAVGPPQLSVDGFFSLNPQTTDRDLLRPAHRFVLDSSNFLRRAAERFPLLTLLAESIYVRATRVSSH